MRWKMYGKRLAEGDATETATSAGKTYVVSYLHGMGASASVTSSLRRLPCGSAPRKAQIGVVFGYATLDDAKAACELHRRTS